MVENMFQQASSVWNSMSSSGHLLVLVVFVFGCFQAARYWMAEL